MFRKSGYVLTICLSVLTTLTALAQNKELGWESKANFAGGKIKGEVAFSVSGKGYVCADNECWQYDGKANSWKKLDNFSGESRKSAVAFTIGNKAYVCTGLTGSGQTETCTADMWEFNTATGKWTKKESLPGAARYGAIGFSINGKGYVGLGNVPGSTSAYTDLWEYDPTADKWTKKADFPDKGRISASVFVINNEAYVLFGAASMEISASQKVVYSYNPQKNQWNKEADFPGSARMGAVTFSINNKGYVFSGYNGVNARYHDFWEYDPANNTWKENTDTLPAARNDAFCFVIDSVAYMGGGKVKSSFLGVGTGTADFWCVGLRTKIDYKAKLVYEANNKKMPLAQQGVSLVSEKKIIQTTTTDNTGAFVFNKVTGGQSYQVVLDKNDKLPANATVAIAKPNGKIVQNLQKNSKGQFSYELSNIDSIEEEDSYFNLQYFMKSQDTVTTITTHINYATGSWELNDEAQNVLYQVVAVLDQYPNLIVRISSHTDAVGSEEDNMKLSEQRAKAAVDFIVANGIDIGKISGAGFGDTKLLNRCKRGVKCSEEENKVNRRTEFTFVKRR